MSEEKFSKCEEGLKKKNYKCGISGVRKKKNWKVKYRGEKKIKVFLGENFKLRFSLQEKVKVWRKKNVRVVSCF